MGSDIGSCLGAGGGGGGFQGIPEMEGWEGRAFECLNVGKVERSSLGNMEPKNNGAVEYRNIGTPENPRRNCFELSLP